AREAAVRRLAARYGVQVMAIYSTVLDGFSMNAAEKQALELSRDPSVAGVWEDGLAHPSTIQPNATWGIDRIDQRPLPLDTNYNYTPTGAGVNVYVIDSGINYSHVEFAGRAVLGKDFLGGNGSDCAGHGTHVAGTVGGATYGVAKGAKLFSVRVFPCSGGAPFSVIINAVDWVTFDVGANGRRPAVVNMSLGGGGFAPLDTAVNNSVNAGITYVVSAGNNSTPTVNYDACLLSPARVPNAITVGATTNADARAVFSNVGKCLDLFAPGQAITSAWVGGASAANTISGTSMSAPHVAGVAALYLQNKPQAKPAEVATEIHCSATSNKITNAGPNSPNLLLFSPLTWEMGTVKIRNKFYQPRCGWKLIDNSSEIRVQ
ncbi:MAG TPA: S8 family peptidase, partial [Pyrinomonadaceae bacterium]|nr:S8 family peptidase [Pyrinomonadaceae bacterium]